MGENIMSEVVHYRSPWSLLNQIAEFDNYFNRRVGQTQEGGNSVSDWVPLVDIIEEAQEYRIKAEIPGVPPNEIKIHVEGGDLSIEGQKQMESKTEKEGYKRVERSSGSFYRRFSLPDTADLSNIKAKTKHGVLEITIPKVEKAKPRQITVVDAN
jgi:HSP20 family protein